MARVLPMIRLMNGHTLPQASDLTPPFRIVVASRDRVSSASLARYLRRKGMSVKECVPGGTCNGALGALEACDVLIVETDGSSTNERELVASARRLSPLAEVIAISNTTAIPEAVLAFRSGLFAVLEYPLNNDELLSTVVDAIRRKRRAEGRIRELNQVVTRCSGKAQGHHEDERLAGGRNRSHE